jgi:serine/threonine protein kinase
VRIVETYKQCNPRYNYQPVIMYPKRDLTYPSEGVLNNGFDNAESDYILRVSDLIVTPEGREYEILDLLGKGTFGQVVKCENKGLKETVAIKVIKNKKAFKNQGVVEIKILDIVSSIELIPIFHYSLIVYMTRAETVRWCACWTFLCTEITFVSYLNCCQCRFTIC